MSDKRIDVTALDFDDIKENLKTFLKQQAQLQTMTLRIWYEYTTRCSTETHYNAQCSSKRNVFR